MPTATEIAATRVRYFLTDGQGEESYGAHDGDALTVAELSALTHGSATKAHAAHIAAYLEAFTQRADGGVAISIAATGRVLDVDDLWFLLEDLDPNRPDPDDVEEVSIEWTDADGDEAQELYKLTRRQLSNLLAKAEELGTDNY